MTTARLHDFEFGIVDSHVHVWDPSANGLDPGIAHSGSKAMVLQTLDQNGVDRAVAIQPSIHGSDHRYLLNAIRESDGRLVGIGLVEPTSPTTTTGQLRELCGMPGVVGIRVPLIRADAGWLSAVGRDIWDAASANALVLCAFVHPSDYGSLRPFLERFPNVRVVIDHVGRLDLAGGHRRESLIDLTDLAAFAHVGIKLSALGAVALGDFPHRESWPEIAEIFAAFGSSRLTWGSDFPSSVKYGPYRNELQAASLALSGCSSGEREAIFRSNALRLYWERE